MFQQSEAITFGKLMVHEVLKYSLRPIPVAFCNVFLLYFVTGKTLGNAFGPL